MGTHYTKLWTRGNFMSPKFRLLEFFNLVSPNGVSSLVAYPENTWRFVAFTKWWFWGKIPNGCTKANGSKRREKKMLVVYEHNESVCCQKVRIVLAEKQIPHEVVNISFETKQQHTPEFEAINPKGKVPVIVHDGRIITESTIIIEYLDEAFPGPQLMPKDPYWRARRRLWARWIDDEMHIPHIATISFNISMRELLGYKQDVRAEGPRGGPPPFMFVGLESKEMLASLHAYQRFLGEMNGTLEVNPWLAGPEYSLADIDTVPYIWRLRNLNLSGLWNTMPRIQDWLDRVSSRPSFQTQIIESELPAWVGSMREKGKQAWPKLARMLETSKPPANPYAIADGHSSL